MAKYTYLPTYLPRPYSYDLSGHGTEFCKRISQLRGIAIDSKNKIQYNSA